MSEDKAPDRSFAVSASGEASEMVGAEARLKHMGVSPGLSAAYDVLDDADLVTDERLELCLAAERRDSDPEAFARHLVKLCRAVRDAPKRRVQ